MLLTDMEDECISQIWSSTQFNQLDTSTPENTADDFINNI